MQMCFLLASLVSSLFSRTYADINFISYFYQWSVTTVERAMCKFLVDLKFSWRCSLGLWFDSSWYAVVIRVNASVL